MKQWSMIAAMSLSLSVTGQAQPATNCEFDGFGADPKLAVAVADSVAYYGCGATRSGCLSMTFRRGQPIVMFRKSADWICGYVQGKDGSAPAWVAPKDVRELRPDPNPPAAAWLGSWSKGDDRIQIMQASSASKLALTGHAIWRGRGGVEHFGDVDGEAAPIGNHIHYSEGPDACTIDLTLFDNYIVGDDNNKCGGVNVRFWGIWTRARK